MARERYITAPLLRDLDSKFVLLSGPRQVGKTTLSKSLPFSTTYLNYDESSHRLMIRRKEWPRDSELVVLDELHKMKDWKRFLKGIYDVEGVRPRILVTGSSRLDIAKRMGDSLAGRFFSWRLHPLCVKELVSYGEEPEQALRKLLQFGGFPEPYFADNEAYYKRWAASHLDIIIRQDLIQLERIHDLAAIETLVELLSQRVGSLVSYQSLARDLEYDAGTIKRWLDVLQNLFVIFKVSPWSKKITKSLRKTSKYYFFDTARVKNGDGARLENLTACALLKELHRVKDQFGVSGALHFLRTRDGRELDFLVALEGEPYLIVESKWSEDQFSPHFAWFSAFFDLDKVASVQIVAEAKMEHQSPSGTRLLRAARWLSGISFKA